MMKRYLFEIFDFYFVSDPYPDVFLSAAYSNDTKKLQNLINTGLDPNYSDSKGRTGEW